MGIQYEKNAVVITEAPAMNYFGNHVRLPDDYGTPAYDERPDVKAIKATVRKSLDDLDAARRDRPSDRAALRCVLRQTVHHPGTRREEPRRPVRRDPHAEDGSQSPS